MTHNVDFKSDWPGWLAWRGGQNHGLGVRDQAQERGDSCRIPRGVLPTDQVPGRGRTPADQRPSVLGCTTMSGETVGRAYGARSDEYISLFGAVDQLHPADRDVIDGWSRHISGPVVDAGC